MLDNEGGRAAEPTVDPFPLWVLPEPLAEFVTEASTAIACPLDYIAVPMLPVLGTAIGTGHRIQIKPGWCEWPIFWTAIVGDTGSAKSPGQEKAVEPLTRLQSKLLTEFEAATQEMLAEKATKKRTTAGRPPASGSGAEPSGKAAAVDAEQSSQIPVPHLRQVVTTDTTLEALNLCLSQNPKGIALVRDELTAWVLGMNEYKKGSGADRPHWQSMWNGSQIVVNRKNSLTPIIIPRPFVCVIGSLPPEMLGELCDEQGREDGFIHRILFAFPDPVPRVLTDEGIRPEAMAGYCDVFDRLRRLRLNILVADPTVTLELPPEVFVVFQDWANGHYAEMESGPTNLRGPWAKLVTYCARLALTIHLSRKVCGEDVSRNFIDEESFSRAIALVTYFKSHAQRVYRHLNASAEECRITAAVDWIEKRGGVASQRDFVTYKVAGVRNAQEASVVFQVMEDNGWGTIEQHTPCTGGRQSTRFMLNCRPVADRLQKLASRRK